MEAKNAASPRLNAKPPVTPVVRAKIIELKLARKTAPQIGEETGATELQIARVWQEYRLRTGALGVRGDKMEATKRGNR